MELWRFEHFSFGGQFYLLLLLYLLSLFWAASFITYKYFLLCSILLIVVDIPLLLKVYDILFFGGMSYLLSTIYPEPTVGLGIICFFLGLIGIVVGVKRLFLNRQMEF